MHGCILVKKDLPDAGEWAHHLQFWTGSLPFPLRSLKHKTIFPFAFISLFRIPTKKELFVPRTDGQHKLSPILLAGLTGRGLSDETNPVRLAYHLALPHLVHYPPTMQWQPLLICVCRFISRTQGADFTWQQRFNNICLTNYLYFILLQYLSKVRPLRLPFLELRLPDAPCPLCRQGPGLWLFHLHFIFTSMIQHEKKKFADKMWQTEKGAVFLGVELSRNIFHQHLNRQTKKCGRWVGAASPTSSFSTIYSGSSSAHLLLRWSQWKSHVNIPRKFSKCPKK